MFSIKTNLPKLSYKNLTNSSIKYQLKFARRPSHCQKKTHVIFFQTFSKQKEEFTSPIWQNSRKKSGKLENCFNFLLFKFFCYFFGIFQGNFSLPLFLLFGIFGYLVKMEIEVNFSVFLKRKITENPLRIIAKTEWGENVVNKILKCRRRMKNQRNKKLGLIGWEETVMTWQCYWEFRTGKSAVMRNAKTQKVREICYSYFCVIFHSFSFIYFNSFN